jgi:hypothetical protein
MCGELVKMLKALDEFESAMKKNLTLINDAKVVREYAATLEKYDRENKLLQNLAQIFVNVIDVLYDFVKFLELNYKLNEKYSYLYQELDEIKGCNLMKENPEKYYAKLIKVSFVYSLTTNVSFWSQTFRKIKKNKKITSKNITSNQISLIQCLIFKFLKKHSQNSFH